MVWERASVFAMISPSREEVLLDTGTTGKWASLIYRQKNWPKGYTAEK
jgi:hypothetical protein